MDGRMNRTAVVMHGPFHVGVEREALRPPEPGEVLVHAHRSAISAGTELLFYRGRVPQDLPLDAGLASLAGPAAYPLRYGYAAVGHVIRTGPDVPGHFLGRRVFCFHPHASHFPIKTTELVPIPDNINDHDALFFANMETAVTLIWDGRPALGETVVILGQGIVGLLATALLARHPLGGLITIDPIPRRRKASLDMGAQSALDLAEIDDLKPRLASHSPGAMADLVFELSGDPSALNTAIELAGFGSRITIGSWYGTSSAAANLGGRFHRSRMRMNASQVSTLPPEFATRWDRRRRGETAWETIRLTRPSRLITHEMPVEQAAHAYDLLDRRPEEALQVVFTYKD
ncbi:MAG: zinc-binding alcohol dehydrogenase [Desulfobacterales bacterium]|nr:zinc-binding alcohol dehydrogenase [Desulfobacterales bacterium]